MKHIKLANAILGRMGDYFRTMPASVMIANTGIVGSALTAGRIAKAAKAEAAAAAAAAKRLKDADEAFSVLPPTWLA